MLKRKDLVNDFITESCSFLENNLLFHNKKIIFLGQKEEFEFL